MVEVDERARKVVSEAVVIDGCSFFSKGWDTRLEKAGVTALQMTIPWPWDDARQALRRYEEYFALTRAEPRLQNVTSVDEIRQVKREGKVGFIFGSQNAQILEDDPGLVEVFHRVGVRVIQLSYNTRNLLADGCLEPTNAGLSRLGKTMIQEMNRVGIQIDLTHVGERSSLEAMEVATKPCIFSHSNPKARSNHPRNITDEQIKNCAAAGGVIGVTPYAPINWTGGDTPPTLEDVADHAQYIVELTGIDHVSFGTDSEATPGAYPVQVSSSLASSYPESTQGLREKHPEVKRTIGFESMENIPELTALLLNRGWSEGDVKKLLGENLLRVYGENWGGV